MAMSSGWSKLYQIWVDDILCEKIVGKYIEEIYRPDMNNALYTMEKVMWRHMKNLSERTLK